MKLIERGFAIVAAAAAIGASAATAVVAAAFALYALLEGPLGRAGASAVVAAVFAALAAVVAIVTVVRAEAKRRNQPPEPTLMEKVSLIAREHPVMTAGGALAAGLMALKNPSLAVALLGAFLAPKPSSPSRDARNRR